MKLKPALAVLLVVTSASFASSQTRRQSTTRASKQQPTFDETIDWVVDKLKLRGEVIVGVDGISEDLLSSRLLNVRRDGRALCVTDKWLTSKREFYLGDKCVKFDDVSSIQFESHWAANPVRVTVLQIHFRHPVTSLKKNSETGEMVQITTDQVAIAMHNGGKEEAAMSIRLKAALLRLVDLSGGLKKEPF